jgi:hypothetical protein
MTPPRKPAEPWDTEKAAELAAEALRYLGTHFPECSGSPALRPYVEAAERRLSELKEAWRRRREDGEESRKWPSEEERRA